MRVVLVSILLMVGLMTRAKPCGTRGSTDRSVRAKNAGLSKWQVEIRLARFNCTAWKGYTDRHMAGEMAFQAPQNRAVIIMRRCRIRFFTAEILPFMAHTRSAVLGGQLLPVVYACTLIMRGCYSTWRHAMV